MLSGADFDEAEDYGILRANTERLTRLSINLIKIEYRPPKREDSNYLVFGTRKSSDNRYFHTKRKKRKDTTLPVYIIEFER